MVTVGLTTNEQRFNIATPVDAGNRSKQARFKGTGGDSSEKGSEFSKVGGKDFSGDRNRVPCSGHPR